MNSVPHLAEKKARLKVAQQELLKDKKRVDKTVANLAVNLAQEKAALMEKPLAKKPAWW